jgi:hypothetical protein
MMPNFLRYPVLNGNDGSFPVSQLSDEDAASLWDEWKQAWLDHVAFKRMHASTAGKP